MQNILTSSPLLWTGLLASAVLLPILIHLINRLRHQRVRWAAMDFLLASHKKNRNWVWLKQLLLLLARIACLLLILLAVGQIGCNNDSMARFLGGNVTHHYVLVDDSLSMGETDSGRTLMDRARESIGMIGTRIAGRDNQKVTLIRFSQVASLADSRTQAEDEPVEDENRSALLNAVSVDRGIERIMTDAAGSLIVTSLADGPEPAVEFALDLIQQRSSEQAIVYVLSDFRSQDWEKSNSLKQAFQQLDASGAATEFIRLADTENANLAITALESSGSVRVAGIPLMMSLQVTNFGQEPARKVQINLKSATYPDEATESVTAAGIQPSLDDLPEMLIEEIPAGESVTRRFPVYFTSPGQHAVHAALVADALPGDDASWVVARFSTSEKVLVVRAGPPAESRFMSIAMAPNGMTGLQVDQANPAVLRDQDASQLSAYETIFLLDIDQLEESANQHLQEYVRQGGGLVFFTGPNVSLQHYSETLYARGNGLFPLPLAGTSMVAEQLDQQSADIRATRHPVFESVLDVNYSPLDLVQVKRVCHPPLEWDASADPAVDVIATIRGDQRRPLMVEKKFGNGTVLACLTTADGRWNNWLRNPTFPTTLLLMQDYVARGNDKDHRLLTGSTREYQLPIQDYRPDVQFVSPTSDLLGLGFDRAAWQAKASQVNASNENTPAITLGNVPGETSLPGVYETWLQTNASEFQVQRFALNVDNKESDLSLATRADLLATASNANVVNWENFGPNANQNRGTSLVRILLVLLLIAMVVEQWLAWQCSYHPGSGRTSGSAQGKGKSRQTFQPAGKTEGKDSGRSKRQPPSAA